MILSLINKSNAYCWCIICARASDVCDLNTFRHSSCTEQRKISTMTGTFIKNLFFGLKCSDEELENVPYPRLELHTHIMYKTIQAGSILGMCLFGPAIGFARGRTLDSAKDGAISGALIGAEVGAIAGPIMTEMRLCASDVTPYSIWDRSYRIRYNQGQCRTDRLATFGALVGLGAAYYFGTPLVNGTVLGFNAGTLSAGVYNIVLVQGEQRKAPKRIIKSN